MTIWNRRGARPSRWSALLVPLVMVALSGCQYTVEPLKGLEGKTYVYAAMGKDGAPNAGIVTTSIGAVVIDPPLSPEIGKNINLAALRASKVFWDEKFRAGKERMPTLAPPVLYALNTTYRASHTFGNQEFNSSADVISTDRAGKHLADLNEVTRMRELLKSQFKVPGLEMHAQSLTQPTITFEGTLTLHTPEVEIKMISMGDCVGEGDCVVLLPQQKVLFAGDLVLVGFMPYYEGRTRSVRNWIKKLMELEQMDIDIVVPGHGTLGGKELLKQQREFLTALLGEVTAAVKTGQPLDQAMKSVKVPNAANWRNYAEWLGPNVRIIYEELTTQGSESKGASGGAAMTMPSTVDGRDPFRDR